MDPISYGVAAKQKQRIEKVIAEPDSTSGVITVPQVIAAGETITVPAGRVAVLPNVQVAGELVVDGEVFIPSGSSFSKVVETEGNQSIDGVKTFSSSPIVPTPINGNQAVNKEYVDGLRIGLIDYGYVAKPYHIVAFGGEFNRADYPKLWAYLQANPTLVKTQAAWTIESTANGGICGFFSSGNGTTTFRVPNLDKAFLRPDSRSIASYQEGSYVVGDSSGSTKSVESMINYDDNMTAFRGRMNWDSLSTVSIGAANLLEASTSGSTSSYQTYPNDFGVTRPKNIAVLPLIVAK